MSPLAQSWLDALARDQVTADLEALFARAADAIAARGPSCWASGRCCNFKAAGHKLYVTGLEAAYTISRLHTHAAPAPPAPTAPIASASGFRLALALAQANDAGTCPFQHANLCTVHTIKPIACRVYFCDRSAQEWQHELSESLLTDIRALHDHHHIEYRYAEWLSLLDQFTPPVPTRS